MSERRAFDLAAGTERLVGPKYESLRKSIQIALATESTYLDLQEVEASVQGLIALGKNAEKAMASAMGRALLTHAVVIYARASHTQTNRFKIGIEGAYSPEQKESHHSVLDLRNKNIAHFGKGQHDWHNEKLVYLDLVDKAALTFAHKRTNVDYGIVFVLKDLVASALAYVEPRKREAADRVDSELLKLTPTEVALVLSVPFEPADFFGIEEDKFWENDSFSSEKNVYEN
jgi:hypothetical protein